MEELLPIFERESIQLRLEPHPDDFIEDGREAVDLIRGINHPNVTFLYCAPHTFHMGGDLAGIMEYAGDLLTHLHVADTFDHRASSGPALHRQPARVHRARAPAPGHRPGRGRLGHVLRHPPAAGVRRDHDRVRLRLGGPRRSDPLASCARSWTGAHATGRTSRSPFFCTEASHRLRRLEHRLLPRDAHDAVG